jgi:colicin import membrane protein
VKSKAIFISKMAAVLGAVSAIAVPTFGFSQPVIAQDRTDVRQGPVEMVPANIAERYRPGSIQSVETADKVLEDAEKERARADAKFAADERACYPKFFVTSCIDAAKEERRRTLAQVQQVEVEANAFKRRARVAERDRALAEKAPLAAPIIKPPKKAKTGEPEASESEPAKTENTDRSGESRRTGPAPETRDRVAEHNARLEKLQEREAADAQKRAENVAAFERKARKAEERQREVAARKAEKERKRAEKSSQPANP